MTVSTEDLRQDATENNSVPDDEISLVDLAKTLWKQRGLIFGFILFSVAVVISLNLFRGTIATPETVDYPISLTFLSTDKAIYPSGSVFSPNDIVSPPILQRVVAKYELKFSALELSKSLSTEYSNSLLDKAEAKLVEILNGNKTPEEVKLAASEALEDLKIKGQRFVTVKLALNDLGLTADQGVELIKHVVDEWAQSSIEQGLADVDISYPTSAFTIDSAANLISNYDAASNYLNALDKAVAELSNKPGTKSMVVSGKGLEDISREIRIFKSTDVDPFREVAYSSSSQLVSSDPAAKLRLFAKKRLLTLEQERLVKLIDSYDNSLSQMLVEQQADTLPDASVGQSTVQIQMEKSVLDRLLNMGSKLGVVENRNKLFERRMDAVNDLLMLEKEIAVIEGVSNEAYNGLKIKKFLATELPLIEEKLNAIQKDVHGLFIVYRDISHRGGAQLFSAQSEPQVRGGTLVSIKQVSMYTMLAVILGLMLGVIAALFRSALGGSDKK
ncbi:MAG: hypothetical protein CSA60_02945 [Neptuniibacter caesariensis]|uniref:Polysaccharide chain length determinant N-terminal domain-containing protein n=1 Tax=Neptuniibacter caesariensis TaxID=207954 RepID=A0A2G6JPG9_NEPCE|nr:MAG: hypothetical protein CSA60_02945 [Neptuniibacter caesariensis]